VRAQAADSQVLQCKAQLEQAQLNLSNTIIRSPATGVVGKRRIEAGQNVSVGQELIDVVSLDDVWITANFKQTQLVHLSPGQPVEIKVDAYGRAWKGHVTNLGGGASSVFRAMPLKGASVSGGKGMPRVPVRIDFDRPETEGFNTEDLLKPGLSVEPKVRVRWQPRTRQPNSVLVGPVSIPRSIAF
jgi:membrane fusion protein (multidrug efflux system)